MILSRRGVFGGLASALAAPAIVRAASLMPVKLFREDLFLGAIDVGGAGELFWTIDGDYKNLTLKAPGRASVAFDMSKPNWMLDGKRFLAAHHNWHGPIS